MELITACHPEVNSSLLDQSETAGILARMSLKNTCAYSTPEGKGNWESSKGEGEITVQISPTMPYHLEIIVVEYSSREFSSQRGASRVRFCVISKRGSKLLEIYVQSVFRPLSVPLLRNRVSRREIGRYRRGCLIEL